MGDMMAKRSAFLDIIKEKGALVLGGALGTELERYGCDIQDVYKRQPLVLVIRVVTSFKISFSSWIYANGL